MIHKKINVKNISLHWVSCILVAFLTTFIMIMPADAAKKKKTSKDQDKKEAAETLPAIERHKLPTDLENAIEQDKKLSMQLSQPEAGPEVQQQIKWLKTPKNDEFLALFKPNIKRPSLGVFIIVPPPGKHANWQGITHELRQHLPQDGWSTISISTPRYTAALDPTLTRKPGPIAIPENIEKDKKNKKNKKNKKKKATSATDPADKITSSEVVVTPEFRDTFPDWEESIMERLDATLAFTQSLSPKKIIIFSEGLSANSIGKGLETKKINPDGLIFNNWNFYSTMEKPSTPNVSSTLPQIENQIDSKLEAIIQKKIPILEIINPYIRNLNANLTQAKARQNESKIAAHPDYLILKTMDGSNQRLTSQWMKNRIRGWLRQRYDPTANLYD